MCTLSQPAEPSSTAQALAMVSAGLGYLAGCDAAGLGTAAQAEALIGLEQAAGRHTAARAKILAAFTAQDGFQADGQYGTKPWLRAHTKITRGAAAGATGWARRLRTRCSRTRWPRGSFRRRGRGRSVTGPASCPPITARMRIRFCSRPLWVARTCTTSACWRKAVIARDQHCQFPGCAQPPSVCQVHHLIPRSRGGATALGNPRLVCRFHHLIVIHRWGWTLTCHPDGTTTATSPNGRTLHSHGPPGHVA